MKIKSIVALLVLISFISACGQASPTSSYPPPGTIPATPTTGAYPPPTTQPTVAAPTPTEQAIVAPTNAEKAATDEVSKKYNIPVDQINIISFEPMTWNNGCMGVVIPGVLCTDVIVNGYVIKLEANGEQFEIHTNQDGTSVIDAAQQLATLYFVVQTTGQSILVLNPNFPLGPTYNPAFNGFLPTGGSIAGVAYVIDNFVGKVLAVDVNGQHDLSFIQRPTTGLATWQGSLGTQPLLAWGTQPTGADGSTSLMIASPDGSNLETLLTISSQTTAPIQLVAELWSADGKSLYFSKEPVGLGGYILFAGASNLYKIDIATKQVTEIIPQQTSNQPQTCLDAISGDYRYVADHCSQGAINIRDMQSATTATLKPPADFTSYKVMGSARFSPAGDRVAFALAKSNPDDEQGWVAIGSTTGGNAKIILTSDSGMYYNIMGWLDDQTLLVQLFSIGNRNGVNQVLAVSTDGSLITKIIDGVLLTVIDNR